MVCPVCETKSKWPGDWCHVCGAYLGFLKRHPRRVAYCICASIVLGMGLFVALAWEVFLPLLRGWPAARPAWWFWWAFGIATFFLVLGLTARRHLAASLRKLFRARRADSQRKLLHISEH